MSEATKHYMSWQDIQILITGLVTLIKMRSNQPDLIIGIGRGGLVPATLLSHHLEIPMLSYHLNLRDHDRDKGYETAHAALLQKIIGTKSVLLVDDINDTGETLKLLESRFPTALSAVLIERSSSYHTATYVGTPFEGPNWIVFPWEVK
jgi:hypoxanthine phosphoribosyltransferase